MNEKNTGGAAFPQEVRYVTPNGQTGSYGPCGGMNLRDYFAAKAMQAAITTSGAPYMGPDQSCADSVSKMAYEMADAMLKAREA